MKTFNLIFVFLLLNFSTLFAQEEIFFQQEIFFESARADLKQDAKHLLDKLADNITNYGDYAIQVAANTDSRGTKTYNKTLASKRAHAVINYLTTKGISTDDLVIESHGEQFAGNDLNSPEMMQRNRRVDIEVIGWNWQNLTDLKDSLSNPMIQKFQIAAQMDKLLDGNKGGKYLIPANVFVDKNGNPVTDLIDIQLVECFTLGDMISMNLHTLSDGEILQTGGMFKLTATSNGQAVYLKKDANISVSIPTDIYRPNMTLFYGAGHGDNDLNWQNTQTPVSSKLPQLRLAKAPKAPRKVTFEADSVKVTPEEIEELANLKKPKQPQNKPYPPNEPKYELIEYNPRGMEKIFLSKKEIQTRTVAKREAKRLQYEKKLARYEERKEVYDAQMNIYKSEQASYELAKAAIIDENGYLVPKSDAYLKLQRVYDLAYKQAMAKYKKDSTAYAIYKKRKTEQYEAQMEALGETDLETAHRYFTQINQLGWANIDRFLKLYPTTLMVARESIPSNSGNAKVYLMFPERDIIIPMNYYPGYGYGTPGIPTNEKAKIFAYKVADRKTHIATQEFVTTEDMVVSLDFKPGRLRDLRMALESL
ncbi:MAG: OmpA family protein [Bacteroidetes bacterium]|nr:MAG: OmpA family protein [Bacteroidota bacterium]